MQTRDIFTGAALAVAIGAPAGHAATLIGDSIHLFPNSTTVSQDLGGRGVGASTTVSNTTGIASVPEPAAWSMMLIGLGGLGTALRARRRGTAARA